MLNNITLMGRITTDPELKTTPSGVSVTSFSIACQRDFGAKDGEKPTDFIDVVCWRSSADFVCRYFSKGDLISICGSLQTRSYVDKQGNKRKAVEVVASNVYFCEGKTGQSNNSTTAQPATQGFISGANGDFAVVSDDEDLPF